LPERSAIFAALLSQGPGRRLPTPGHASCPAHGVHQPTEIIIMGKYLLAWILGVPGIVLVVLYFFFR
jgi:hypothetical protein